MIKASINLTRTGKSCFTEHYSSFQKSLLSYIRRWPIRKFCSSDDMGSQPWREAASLIITSRLPIHDVVAKGKNLANLMANVSRNYDSRPKVTDYRILMVKRSRSSSFMASAYVFPGGVVEIADYSPRWWSVFEKTGFTRTELENFCSNFQGERPSMVTNPVTLKSKDALKDDYLPPDIALRIAALRETFEETGVLLLTNPDHQRTQKVGTSNQNSDYIQTWQEKIHNDPYKFLDLCFESHMCPDIWSLYEWSDWFTPVAESRRRYDTIFYLCCLPHKPEVLLDKGEVTVMKWCSPEEMLESHSQSSLFLAPPQVYELSRLIQIPSYHELKNFAKNRETQGCQKFMPVIFIASDGIIASLPGDDLYSHEANGAEIGKPGNLDSSLDDLRAKSKNLHRIEMRGPRYTIHCNISPQCGHLQPIQYRPSEPNDKPSL